MTATVPYQGHFAILPEGGKQHLFAVRVYFEDTDFSGVVYHARYLHFMERARSDMLARLGIAQREAHGSGLGAYAVTEMQMKFRRPAHFDDALLVTSNAIAVRGASCDIHQTVSRDGEKLVEAKVTAAFVAPDGRPARQPAEWVAAFRSVMNRIEG
jgi:acyl-CoA thioester hydrolase